MDQVQAMRVFVRVAQRASFAAAARDLGVSPASVTKQVAALEDRLGARLLERTTRQVQLTEAGRVYLERCHECLQALDEADAAISELSGAPRGVLRLTAPVDFARHLARVVARYAQHYPRVRVDMRLANHAVDLIDQGLDLGIGFLQPSDTSYVARPLTTSRMALWASPTYLRARGRPRTLADLQRHTHLVFTEPRPRTELALVRRGRATRVHLEPALLVNSGEALRIAVVDGLGLSAAPSFLMADDHAAGRVEPVLLDYALEPLRLYVRYPSRRFLPAKVRAFLEALRSHFGEDPERDAFWPRS